MGLYERLTNEEQPNLSGHAISGLLGELERGKITAQQVVNALGLSAGETTEAQSLLAQLVPPRESISIGGGGITLTNVGAAYDTTTAAQGLGFALVQAAGITQVVFDVRVQKVGTGTQDWQLWNETNGTEVAVISDTASAGAAKYLTTTVNFDPALGPGIKRVRVRARSSVAADDPVFFGASVSIRRVSSLTALELHEIILCAQHQPPAGGTGVYNTATALKARLGIS